MQSYRITEHNDGRPTMRMRVFAVDSDQEAAIVAQKYADEESLTESVSLHRSRLADDSDVLIGWFTRSVKQESACDALAEKLGHPVTPPDNPPATPEP